LITANYKYQRSGRGGNGFAQTVYSTNSTFKFQNYNNGQTMYDTKINVSSNQIISEIKVVFKRASNGINYANWTGQLWISKH